MCEGVSVSIEGVGGGMCVGKGILGLRVCG